MSIMPLKLDESSGTRVISVRLASGSAECMSCRRSGRRNARTNEVKSAAPLDNFPASTGMEGMYLKLGKRSAEAVEGPCVAGAIDEVETRTLLKG